jgi:hypothetical protein
MNISIRELLSGIEQDQRENEIAKNCIELHCMLIKSEELLQFKDYVCKVE